MRRKWGMLRIPRFLWSRAVRAEAKRSQRRLGFMTADHHAVRDFVVLEVARRGTPVEPEQIAGGTGLDGNRVAAVLDDLERHLTFCFRSDGRRVDWAYPVAAAATPHRVTLDTGDRFFGA